MAHGTDPPSPSQDSPEPRGFLYIFLAAFSFLVGRFFSKPLSDEHQHLGSTLEDSRGTASQNQTPSSQILVTAKLHTPDSTERYRRTNDRRNYAVQKCIAIGTWCAVIAAAVYGAISAAMWVQLKEQTRVERNAYIAAQRPWIKILNVESRGNSDLGGLSFSGFGHEPFPTAPFKAGNMQLQISTKNIGHSVAELFVDFELFFPLWESTGPTAHGYSTGYANVVAAEKKRFCEESSKKAFPLKVVVFPDEPNVWYGGPPAAVTPTVINRMGNDDFVLPVVIVCANYHYPPMKDTFQTSALFEAFRNDNRSRFFVVGRNMPANTFWLERNAGEDNAH